MGTLYFIHHRTTTNTWMLHAPIGVCLFCLLRLCLRSIWLGRLRVVRWFPVLLQSVRLIISAGQAYRKPPIKLRAVVVLKFAHPWSMCDVLEKRCRWWWYVGAGGFVLPEPSHDTPSPCRYLERNLLMKMVTFALSVPSHVSKNSSNMDMCMLLSPRRCPAMKCPIPFGIVTC